MGQALIRVSHKKGSINLVILPFFLKSISISRYEGYSFSWW
jgi:hypothetical protein